MRFSSLLLFLIPFWFYGQNITDTPVLKNRYVEIKTQDNVKEQAFAVLADKCNVCHATKKKTDIFTPENMDSLAPDIHKQVFIKRKMPKGRKIKLTEEERETLKEWVLTVIDGPHFTN